MAISAFRWSRPSRCSRSSSRSFRRRSSCPSAAILFAIVLGVPAGVVAAVKRGGIVDHVLMGAALTGFSMPIFWWGLLLILFVSLDLGWTPVSGRIDLIYYFEPVTGFMLIDSLLSGQEGAFSSALSHLILPAIVLGTIPLAVFARMTRSVDARGARRGLRAHGARQGSQPLPRRRPACAPQRPDPGRDRDRPAGGDAARRRGADREHLFLAGRRQAG